MLASVITVIAASTQNFLRISSAPIMDVSGCQRRHKANADVFTIVSCQFFAFTPQRTFAYQTVNYPRSHAFQFGVVYRFHKKDSTALRKSILIGHKNILLRNKTIVTTQYCVFQCIQQTNKHPTATQIRIILHRLPAV